MVGKFINLNTDRPLANTMQGIAAKEKPVETLQRATSEDPFEV